MLVRLLLPQAAVLLLLVRLLLSQAAVLLLLVRLSLLRAAVLLLLVRLPLSCRVCCWSDRPAGLLSCCFPARASRAVSDPGGANARTLDRRV